MTRKGKQTGGNLPLTHYEANKKFRSSQYGTTTTRLSTGAMGKFGDCSLSLSSPTTDAVATPSGHIYSREAIVDYMVTKMAEIKLARANYEAYLAKKQAQRRDEAKQQVQAEVASFEESQKASSARSSKKQPRDSKEDNPLKRTSYWLAEFQPEADEEAPPPPPNRPPSPFTGEPLRRKDLQPLILQRSSGDGKVLCAVSNKTIVTQPVVALCGPCGGHVILEEFYKTLVKPTMTCPITGKKLKSKHILTLQRGRSGFSASGTVEAKMYRPTIT